MHRHVGMHNNLVNKHHHFFGQIADEPRHAAGAAFDMHRHVGMHNNAEIEEAFLRIGNIASIEYFGNFDSVVSRRLSDRCCSGIHRTSVR